MLYWSNWLIGPTNSGWMVLRTEMVEIMEIRPINRKTAYEDITLQIRAMISRGDLLVGDKLPPERKLAEMFSVSRNTVREAIKALAEGELLESRQGAGTYVRAVSERGASSKIVDFSLQGKPELRDIFEVRKLMEPEMAALAARNAPPHEVTHLEAILIEQEAAIEAGDTGSGFDQRFHELLAVASGNAVLRQMVAALHEDLTESRGRALQSYERQKASLAAHRSIVEAVKSGHVMQAEKAMREHLEEIERIVFSDNY